MYPLKIDLKSRKEVRTIEAKAICGTNIKRGQNVKGKNSRL